MPNPVQQDVPPNMKLAATKAPVTDFDAWIGFTERQLDAIACGALYDRVLYGGAAGGGKSYMLRWGAIRENIRCAKQYGVKGIRFGVFCKTYPELEDRQLSKVRLEVPKWLGKLNEQRHELRLNDKYGGGVICFRNLDNPQSYLSAEFGKAYFEEQTTAEEDKYDFIGSRLRWPGVPAYENTALGATNPGGIGHAWCKRRWIDGHLTQRERTKRYAFIPAKALDNPHLPDGYYDNLRSLPEKLARAYADGCWDVFEGQYFVEWDSQIHVVRPFQIPKQWVRFRAMDYGFAAPAAVGWWAVNPWYNQLICYRELYVTQHNPEMLAKRILAMTPADEEIAYTVIDPACWANTAGKGSVADDLMTHGLACMPGDNNREAGWFRVRQYLQPFEVLIGQQTRNVARMAFFSTCTNHIRTIPALIHDEHRPEDVDTDGDDHCGDETRYAVMSRPVIDLTSGQAEVDAYRERRRLEGLYRDFPDMKRRHEAAQGTRGVGA
jgi:phage terminase large subunit